MRTITLEEHFYTESFLSAVRNRNPDALAPPIVASVLPKLTDLGPGRIAAMDEAGVDLQVLSLASIGFDSFSAAESIPLARDINDELAAAIRTHPTRFAGFATLPVKDPSMAAKELERCITQLGFSGVMLNGTTSIAGAPALSSSSSTSLFFDDPHFLPIFEAAVHLNVPVYLHPAPPPTAVKQVYYANLPGETGNLLSIAGWGWHSETALHTLRLIVSGLFDKFPTLQLIIGHMGEGLPYWLLRSSDMLSKASSHLRQPVADYFRTNIHLTTSGFFTQPPLRCAIDVIGMDRLMYSVDYPFASNAAGRKFLSETQLSKEDLARLTHRNAETLLKLPPAGTETQASRTSHSNNASHPTQSLSPSTKSQGESIMRRILFWSTLASGAVAAYLMSRRGASITEIAKNSIGNPVGSLVNELKQVS
ncbi:MAG TPA: amidohydrolase family protein [Acidobacteriaceae bacterium]|nr:amidohydrolase family protein [Acidobacteriaceae bacterium]